MDQLPSVGAGNVLQDVIDNWTGARERVWTRYLPAERGQPDCGERPQKGRKATADAGAE
ncbi:MAG: hypothetical protein R3E39_25800 [Anaerolineae bacterium]